MTNTHCFKSLLMLAALMGVTACGGGGDSDSTVLPPPPAAPASFSFPVVATTTTPQGCVREDGKPGVSAVTYYKRINASDLDQVVLACDSPSGRRVLRSQPGGLVPTLLHVDAAGTVVAMLRDGSGLGSVRSIFAMLPGSTQEIELVAAGSPFLIGFVGVFNNRVLYTASHTGHAIDLHSVTISQTPTTTFDIGNAFGTLRVHDRPVGGRVFFATVGAFSPFDTEYRSVRPDGTDPLLLRTASAPGPEAPFTLHVLGDREVIYFEIARINLVPNIRMLAIDTPGSDLLIAEASVVFDQVLTVPGTANRFVFLGRYPNTTEPILADVNAERGNLSIGTLALPNANEELLGFSQGRLHILGGGHIPNILGKSVAWLGEGGTAPRTVLTGIREAYHVTDRAIVYSRTPLFSNRITYTRSDLDGTNERAGSFAALIPNEDEAPTRAGERIYYLREPDTINNDVATLDLVTGVETVVYRPNPAQDRIRFFRVGGRLIVWRPARGTDPGWIDSVDLDGNDLRRLDQSPDILEAKPF